MNGDHSTGAICKLLPAEIFDGTAKNCDRHAGTTRERRVGGPRWPLRKPRKGAIMKLAALGLALALAFTGTCALAQSTGGSAGGSSATGGAATGGTATGSSTSGTTSGGTTTGNATGSPADTGMTNNAGSAAAGRNSATNPSGNSLLNPSPSGSTLTPAAPGSTPGR
jgi:hypothetical protein